MDSPRLWGCFSELKRVANRLAWRLDGCLLVRFNVVP